MKDSQSSDSLTPIFSTKVKEILESVKNNTATEIDLQQRGLGDD